MSELKAIHAFDVYEEYTKTGDDEAAQVYLKSEADNIISTIRAERDEYRYNLSCARNEIHNLSMSMREDVKRIADKDKAIAELKGDIADLRDDKKSTDAILDERNAEIAELKRQIEFLKTTHDSCGNCSKCAEGMGKVFDENLDKLKADYKEACDRLQTANIIKDEQLAAARHHKYKRCLAMAKICENKLGTVVKPGWWDKWRRRWLELAEKFKEAK